MVLELTGNFPWCCEPMWGGWGLVHPVVSIWFLSYDQAKAHALIQHQRVPFAAPSLFSEFWRLSPHRLHESLTRWRMENVTEPVSPIGTTGSLPRRDSTESTKYHDTCLSDLRSYMKRLAFGRLSSYTQRTDPKAHLYISKLRGSNIV